MLLLSRIALVIIFAVVVQCIHGYQRIVQVRNDDISSNCCLYRNCSCHSFDHALAHLTSNVLLNITTDVTLTSVSYVSNLRNISIIGHNNPTVNCKGAGGIHLFLCTNCIIQGITWDECGVNNYNEPALQLTFAYNTTIQNCSFKHSREQAIASSKGLGYLNIKYCKFVHNSHYIGAIISYSFLNRFKLFKLIYMARHLKLFTSLLHRYKSFSAMIDDIIAKSSQLSISIHGCDFSNNKGARRLIYINNLWYEQNIHFTISSSKFYHNQGVSVYIINQLLHITGKILFQNNTAKDGAGVYISDHSTIVFGENSSVTFLQNSVHGNGSAVFSSWYSTVIFDKNSKVRFISNKATYGTVYSGASCNVAYKGACNVIFYNNSVLRDGVALCSSHSNISFESNAYTEFNNNGYAKNIAGAIFVFYSHISFKNNSTTKFSNNAGSLGGAITAYNSHVSFKGNSTTEFSNNSAGVGGALCAFHNSHISFKDNSAAKFNSDYAGAAILIFSNSNVSFEDNSTVAFNVLKDNNAISAMNYAKIIFDGNCTVSFTINKSTLGVMVILISISKNSDVTARGNFNVTFNHQSAEWCTNTCLPYPSKENDDVKIDNFGIVRCNNPNRFICQSKNCQCKNFEDGILNITNNAVVTLSAKVMTLSSAINLSNFQNISIIGRNNLAVVCANGSSLQVEFCNNLTIQGIAWFGCESALKIHYCKDVIIRNCSFLYSKERAIEISKPSGNVSVDHCKFMHNNHYRGHGSAIHYESNDPSTDKLTIKNSDFSFNIGSKSIICIKQSQNNMYVAHHHINNSSFHNNQATSIYLSGYLYFTGNIPFRNNIAETGTGIYISNHSTVVFGENSTVKFINNTADYYGAAIFLNNHSSVVFDKNSIVNFRDNYATNGTVYSKYNSVVLFMATCEVMFDSNRVGGN